LSGIGIGSQPSLELSLCRLPPGGRKNMPKRNLPTTGGPTLAARTFVMAMTATTG
jgi:hypothetical protein